MSPFQKSVPTAMVLFAAVAEAVSVIPPEDMAEAPIAHPPIEAVPSVFNENISDEPLY